MIDLDYPSMLGTFLLNVAVLTLLICAAYLVWRLDQWLTRRLYRHSVIRRLRGEK